MEPRRWCWLLKAVQQASAWLGRHGFLTMHWASMQRVEVSHRRYLHCIGVAAALSMHLALADLQA